MASMTNQTDFYTKTEVNTAVGTKADNTAYLATKGIVDNATTGVAALNTKVSALLFPLKVSIGNTTQIAKTAMLDVMGTTNITGATTIGGTAQISGVITGNDH